MLNCCIEKKIKREKQNNIPNSISSTSVSGKTRNSAMNDVELESKSISECSSSSSKTDMASSVSSGGSNVRKTSSSKSMSEEGDSSEEEFFECEDESSQISEENIKISNEGETDEADVSKSESGSETIQSETKAASVSSSASFVSLTPEGRLHQCGDLDLLEVDEPLYIPVTQEPAPMTEDMLEEHAQVLTK